MSDGDIRDQRGDGQMEPGDDAQSARSAEARAADIHADLLQRSQGMTDRLQRELFEQERTVGKGREIVSPAIYVEAAEGRTIFRGLKPERMNRLREALLAVAQDPERAREQYEALLHRNGNGGRVNGNGSHNGHNGNGAAPSDHPRPDGEV